MILVDPPTWPGRGRVWSHLVSDTSFAELHGFAAGLGLPPGAFHRDHYDLPETLYASAVAAGATPAPPREIVTRLRRAGLRRPRRFRSADHPEAAAPQ